MTSFEDKIHAAVTPGPDRVSAGFVFCAANASGLHYQKAFGSTSIAPDAAPLAEDAMMWLASCTKLVTSVAVLQCVERGLLDLDEDVVRLLPELTDIGVLKDMNEDGSSIVEPAKGKVTLRRLLTHSSGFTYAFMSPELLQAHVALGLDPATARGDIDRFAAGPLIFEPGQGWAYSTGLELAGRIVERVNDNISLGQLFEKNIFAPLGMVDFVWRFNSKDEMKSTLMGATIALPGKPLKRGRVPWPHDAKHDCGGGGLFGKATEYLKLLQAILREDPSIMKKTSYDKLYNVEIKQPRGPMTIPMLYASYPRSAPVPFDEVVWDHGLAGAIAAKDVPGWLRKGTLKWGGMANCEWWIDRESKLVAFMATQVLPYEDEGTGRIKGLFYSEMLKRYGLAPRKAAL